MAGAGIWNELSRSMGTAWKTYLPDHTRGAEPTAISLIYTLHGRVQTPKVKGSRAAVAVYKGTVRFTR